MLYFLPSFSSVKSTTLRLVISVVDVIELFSFVIFSFTSFNVVGLVTSSVTSFTPVSAVANVTEISLLIFSSVTLASVGVELSTAGLSAGVTVLGLLSLVLELAGLSVGATVLGLLSLALELTGLSVGVTVLGLLSLEIGLIGLLVLFGSSGVVVVETFVPRLTTLSTLSLVTFSSILGLSWRTPFITVKVVVISLVPLIPSVITTSLPLSKELSSL